MFHFYKYVLQLKPVFIFLFLFNFSKKVERDTQQLEKSNESFTMLILRIYKTKCA